MINKTVILIIAVIMVVIAILLVNGNRPNKQLGNVGEEINISVDFERAVLKDARYQKAKELAGISGYLNTDKITIEENIGKKVILVDFWTYSCINCQRTLPYLNAWWDKYKDDGLLIIGVHTPEFDFEKEYENVRKAIEKYGVKYPVVQDNDYQTWQAYNNRYWPRKYLIDIDGYVVYDHIGEGKYEETEKKIQELLEERKNVLKLNEDVDDTIVEPSHGTTGAFRVGTPEIYFGLLFSRKQFGNPEGWQAEKTIRYAYPESLKRDLFYLNGDWKTNPDNMELTGESGGIKIKYSAKDVNLVAGSNNPGEIIYYVDGREIGRQIVRDFDLYKIVEGNEYGEHELEIKASKGLMAYTFTFG